MSAAEIIDEMNLDKSFAFYKDRFADAGDFTFVFVGSFDAGDDEAAGRAVPGVAAVDRPQGDLEGRRHGAGDGRGEKTVKKGVEPQSQVAIVFSGPFT